MDMTDDQIRDLNACLHGVNEIKTQMSLVVRLINGNPDEDIVGMRPRLRQIEDRLVLVATAAELAKAEHRIVQLETEWTALKNQYRGAKWVLGLLGATNLVTIAALVRFLFGMG